MRSLLALLLCFGLCAAVKEYMVFSNRVPVHMDVPALTSTCDECQSLVHRFHEAINDPEKLNELKTLLRVLCHETSYVDECRVFVNNLDSIVKKLEPYLKDAKAVCHKIHMCSTRLDRFHKIGVLFAQRMVDKQNGYKDLVCDECQFAATELKSIIDDKKTQEEIRDFFRNNVCAKLGSYRGSCDLIIEEFLPEFFQELEALLKNPKQTCQQIGFCSSGIYRQPKLTGFVGFLSRL